MCMLTVIPDARHMADSVTDGIYNGTLHNDDGHGWAVVVGNRVRVGHGMSVDDTLDAFRAECGRATGPAMFHSRWATHGTVDESNAHPFRVPSIGEAWLAHNGIMPAEAHPHGGDKRSDTRIFAERIMHRYRRLDSARVSSAMERWLGGNKVAIVTTARKLHEPMYLFGEHLGEWRDGAWYSNSDYRTEPWWIRRKKIAQQYGSMSDYYSDTYRDQWSGNGGWVKDGRGVWHWSEDAPKPCDVCGEPSNEGEVCRSCKASAPCVLCRGVVDPFSECIECHTCQDCLEHASYCQCYTPRTVTA